MSTKKNSGASHKAAMLRAGLGMRGGTDAGQAAAAGVVTTGAAAAPELTRSQRLANLESILHASRDGFRKAQKKHIRESAEALRAIKADDLHEEAGYQDFDAYVAQRVGWDLSYAYRLIDLDYVGKVLEASPIKDLTEDSLLNLNEAQARVLAKAARDQGEEAIVSAWAEAHGLGELVAAKERPALVAHESTPRSPIGENPGARNTSTPMATITASVLTEAVQRLYAIPEQQQEVPPSLSGAEEAAVPNGEHQAAEDDVLDAEVVDEHEEQAQQTPALDRLDSALANLRSAHKDVTARVINAARDEGAPERFRAVLEELRSMTSRMDGVTERAVAKDKKLRAQEAAAASASMV
ncbi:hypothetical protein ACIP93_37435 [Streptomyces sp. NPDC088745]|uniref:hypothetical protein n=1 Tax=Streptomyces sp. NPDC088745 TaxID=3365884 RepID=UPI00380E64A2